MKRSNYGRVYNDRVINMYDGLQMEKSNAFSDYKVRNGLEHNKKRPEGLPKDRKCSSHWLKDPNKEGLYYFEYTKGPRYKAFFDERARNYQAHSQSKETQDPEINFHYFTCKTGEDVKTLVGESGLLYSEYRI